MAYKHVIRAKTKNLLSDIIVRTNSFGLSYDEKSGIFTVLSNDKVAVGFSQAVMDFITPIPVGTVITVSIYCISGRYKATQGDHTAIGGYHKYVSSTDLNIWQGLVILPSGTDLSGKTFTTTWTVTKPLDAFWIYAPRQTDIIEEDIKFRAQLELGSTPTPYTPYNYLQSNKRMIKVSDVCQLLDKSKYNLPHTESGLTFTAGTDGSIIVNGTCTSTVWANISSFELNPEHTFILIGCPGTNVNDVALYTADAVTGDSKQWEEGRGSLVTGNFYKNKANYLYIRILTGYVCNNLTFKPQLYDLTEMYGAGHEPATVAEFRQRFPNELYPYSPQCWLTSYKSAVVCKTKNLFDVNNAVPYKFDNNPTTDEVFIKDGIYTTRLNNYNLGSGLRIKDGWTLPAGVYTLSVKVVDCADFGTNGFANTGFYYKTADGTWHELTGRHHSYAPGKTLAFATNIPEHIELRLYLNYQNMNGQRFAGYISYKDIQVEQGSTATSYVPYQHL